MIVEIATLVNVFLSFFSALLHKIFKSIYDIEVVSESVFRAWKDNGSEGFGRGVALWATSPFFDWLGSTECESDAET